MSGTRETHVITTIELVGNCLLLLGKVLKSLLFNLLIFILGFGVAYVYIVTLVHTKATQNQNYECIQQIESELHQQMQICHKIEAQLNVLKIKSAHDVDPICNHLLVKPFMSEQVSDDHK